MSRVPARGAWWMVVCLLGATGCEGQLCALLGSFVGAYEGDLEGSLDAEIAENPDDAEFADVSLTLTGNGSVFSGVGKVKCTDGDLVLDLTDVDGASVGEVTGLLSEGTGSGDYSLFGGGGGTWSY